MRHLTQGHFKKTGVPTHNWPGCGKPGFYRVIRRSRRFRTAARWRGTGPAGGAGMAGERTSPVRGFPTEQ